MTEQARQPHAAYQLESRNRKARKIEVLLGPEMLVEPHYRLPFLSWLPHSWRNTYLQISGRRCEPLRLGELDQLLREIGLVGQHKKVEALRIMQALEPIGGWLGNVLPRFPDRWLAWVWLVIPTLICVFSNEHAGNVAR